MKFDPPARDRSGSWRLERLRTDDEGQSSPVRLLLCACGTPSVDPDGDAKRGVCGRCEFAIPTAEEIKIMEGGGK